MLDRRRLGKQRVEALQVLRGLTVPGYGWRRHPAVRMWIGYEEALVRYGLEVCRVWRDQGHQDTCAASLVAGLAAHRPGHPVRDQQQLAAAVGVTYQQAHKYEKGINRISAIHLEILSRMTGMPIDYFFDGMNRSDDAPPRGLSEAPQQAFVPRDGAQAPWSGLVDVVAKHVTEHFSDANRREFAAAIHALDEKLNG